MGSDIYEFDIAVSFATENKEYVIDFVSELSRHPIKIFFDRQHEVEIWGDKLYLYLQEVFNNKARHCIIFTSKEYKQKHWTMFELETILARHITKPDENRLVLFVKLDDTEIPGVNPTLKHLCAANYSPHQLAEATRQRIESVCKTLSHSNENTTDYHLPEVFTYLKNGLGERSNQLNGRGLNVLERSSQDQWQVKFAKSNRLVYDLVIRNNGIFNTNTQISFWDSVLEDTNSDSKYTAIVTLNSKVNPPLKIFNLGLLEGYGNQNAIVYMSKEELLDLIWQKMLSIYEAKA